jgi:CRISPR-associated endonuclease/helicase Cas3
LHSKEEVFNLVYNFLKDEGVSVLIAPTSYGKTLFSPLILKAAKNDEIAYGLIHVVPYRALVKDIYISKFSKYSNEFSIGYQCMDLIDFENKTPFFLRELVVTTLDSYAWNAYGIPVAEYDKILRGVSKGHAYAINTSIYTSINVFDEAHIFTGDVENGERGIFKMVLAIVNHLIELQTPVVIESATLPSNKLAEFGKKKKIKVIYVCRTSTCGNSLQRYNYANISNVEVVVVPDKEWYESNEFLWKTQVVGNSDAISYITDNCSSKPILVIRNTVARAIETYNTVKSKCEAVLIHGLMGSKERERYANEARGIVSKGRGVVIATQVIEAGVEVDALALVTDIAPIENIAQRAGRLCRSDFRKQECREENVEVILINSPRNEYVMYEEHSVKNTLEELINILNHGKNIDWRLLEDHNGYTSFTNVMELVYSNKVRYSKSLDNIALESVLKYDTFGDDMLMLLSKLGLINSLYLVKMVVDEEYENTIAIELQRLIELEEKVEKRKNVTCIDYDKKRGVKIHVLTSDNRVFEIDTYLKACEKEKTCKEDFIDMLSRVYRKIYDEARKKGTTVKDFFVVLKRNCYSNEVGAFYNVFA